jgi:Na+-transporting NADH:ubiquinone oxidoreductase subunit NqrF
LHRTPEDIDYCVCGPAAVGRAVIAMRIELGDDRENTLPDDFGKRG